MPNGGSKNAGLAVLLVVLILGGGGAAIYLLTRKEGEPQAAPYGPSPDQGVRMADENAYGGVGMGGGSVVRQLGDQLLGPGAGEAAEVVGQALAVEGGKVLVQASRDVARAHNAVTGAAADVVQNAASIPSTVAKETGATIRSGVTTATGFVRENVKDVLSVPRTAVKVYTGGLKTAIKTPGRVAGGAVSAGKKAVGGVKKLARKIF